MSDGRLVRRATQDQTVLRQAAGEWVCHRARSPDWRQVLPTYRRSVVPRKAGAAALPLVAIVGRPNVGKSTLFNRLTHSRRSIVGDEPGITRDRIYGEYEWAGRQFRLVDTGGIVPDDPELIPTEIYNQAKVALEEADALVLVVDARTELASPDYDLVKLLIRGGKPVFLAVNKVEGEAMAAGGGELPPAWASQCVSHQLRAWAGHRRSAGCDCRGDSGGGRLTATDEADADEAAPTPAEAGGDESPRKMRRTGSCHRTHGEFEQHETSVAIIGRPNVGKSTLLNALTGTSARHCFARSPGRRATRWTRWWSSRAANCGLWIRRASGARARRT